MSRPSACFDLEGSSYDEGTLLETMTMTRSMMWYENPP